MVVNSYDIPMGYPEETVTEKRRKHPSQPSMQDARRSSANETVQHTDPTINHKSFGTAIGRDLISKTEPKLGTSQRTAYGKGRPRYVLRTVTPSKPKAIEEALRPPTQHIPGSYRSESELGLSLEAPVLGSTAKIELTTMEDDAFKHQDRAQSSIKEQSEGQDILKRTADQLMTTTAPHQPLDQALRPIDIKTSQSPLGSYLSSERARHPLLQPSVESTGPSQPMELLLIPVLDQGHPLVATDTEPPSKTTPKVLSDTSALPDEDDMNSTAQYVSSPVIDALTFHEHSTMDCQKVVKSLAEFPPFSGSAMNHLNAQPAMTDLVNVKKPTHEVLDLSVRTRRSSLRLRPGETSRKSSLGLAQTKRSVATIGEQENEISGFPLSKSSSEAGSSISTTSRKLFANGRAITYLSEMSPRPLTDTSPRRSVSKHDMAYHQEPSLSKKSPSLLSTDRATFTNEHIEGEEQGHQPKLLSQASYQTPASIPPTGQVDRAQPTSHWVNQLLGRQSSTSVPHASPTNLTARPSNRPKQELPSSANNDSASIAPATEELTRLFDVERISLRASDSKPFTYNPTPQLNPESFSKVIVELEVLLKEALAIAHQAAEKDEMSKHNDLQDTKLARPRSTTDDYHRYLQGEQETEETQCMGHEIKVPLAPGAELSCTSSEHAKDIAARLGIPSTRPRMEFPAFENPNDYQTKLSRSSLDVVPERMPVETLSDFQDVSLELNNKLVAKVSRPYPEATVQPPPQAPIMSKLPAKEQQNHLLREPSGMNASSREDVLEYIGLHHTPPIHPRTSSAKLRNGVVHEEGYYHDGWHTSEEDVGGDMYVADFHQPGLRNRGQPRQWIGSDPRTLPGIGPGSLPQHDTITSLRAPPTQNVADGTEEADQISRGYSLSGRHHFSIRGRQGFSLSRSHQRAPIARDWSVRRKRFVATVTCINTALIGLIIGIYAGEVPAIQYAIVDESHYAIQGNVVFYIGMAIPTILFFPLPLLHGRKPYTLAALGILLPLQFPQAVAVGQTASPYLPSYRVGLLLSRAFAGILAGFLTINLKTTLLDLFGASLQSGNPHQETVNENDIRRHGGGMGLWLGIWVWCSIGSIGIGFLIGAAVISGLPVTWGFWITIILTAAVLILNVMTPEVRRSPYRRSMAEVNTGTELSRRIARGEIKMHLYSTGPKRWWEEVTAGHVLCIRMLMQPGFLILSFYMGWIYGQIIMVIVLLGALTSKYYMFQPQYVGLCVAAIPIGALLAIPFQKASLFSRARHHSPRTDSMTFEKRVTWTSHLIRRSVFMFLLPFAGLAYTLSSGGPDTSFMVPTFFAGAIGFLSCLAIAECNGLIMETYDTSDLQPGMTGRPRRILPEDDRRKRTNFSCFPRVTAAFAVNQTFAFLIAAAATGTGGSIERRLGAQTATAVVAGILLFLTLLLIAALTRFKTVQIVPTQRYGTNVLGGPEDEWKPIVIGHPSGTTRRLSFLEMGKMTRWSEIRRRNRLIEG
ncbi:hypothetical protein MMC13_005062 [Lambiella insularis]|nr:hypothetical protein [Lambiella insularis]